MELVVDTNILISALVKDSKTRELLCNGRLILYAPEHILLEINAHREEIIAKAGISKRRFQELLALLMVQISIVRTELFRKFLKEALKIASHPEDAPFLALAMHITCPYGAMIKG
ncbi:MAG: PIN domain-containing protein [Candidatus Diapherotrites archaeon]|nr:PIN domain-containing protein [Candidatus Diapherotrites archaeon]